MFEPTLSVVVRAADRPRGGDAAGSADLIPGRAVQRARVAYAGQAGRAVGIAAAGSRRDADRAAGRIARCTDDRRDALMRGVAGQFTATTRQSAIRVVATLRAALQALTAAAEEIA